MDGFLDFIKDNCDITASGNGERTIYSCGLGGNLYKNKIEEQLNVELKNLAETDCLIRAACEMLKTLRAEELFKPLDQEGKASAKGSVQLFKGMKGLLEASGKGRMFIKEEVEPYDSVKDIRFPFILTQLGSSFGMLQVEEDGTYEYGGFVAVGGRCFLGLVSYLTSITDFNEISKLIKESTGKSVDTFSQDLFDSSLEDDHYAALGRDQLRVFPFGKALTEREKATNGDLIHSLLETTCENVAEAAMTVAQMRGVPRVYFAGNFINTPKAQQFITKYMRVKQHFMQKEQVNFEFLKDGGYFGAIGAFTEAHSIQQQLETGN